MPIIILIGVWACQEAKKKKGNPYKDCLSLLKYLLHIGKPLYRFGEIRDLLHVSFFDGIFQGLGYTCVLIIMCIFREFFGSGRFGGGLIDVSNGFRFTLDGTGAGIQIFPSDYGASILNLPFGGFITLGLLIALMQYALSKSKKKKELALRAAQEEAEKKEAEE